MSDYFIRGDELKRLQKDTRNCGVCAHRTSYLGYCVKKGAKVSQWEGPCPEYVRRGFDV